MDMFPRRKAKPITNVNLTPIMDIFSVLIIFFVKANVLSANAVEVPANVKVPKSISSETVETAPEVMLYNDEVNLKIINRTVKIDDLIKTKGELNDRGRYVYIELKKYIESFKIENQDFGLTVNFVSSNETSYKKIYDVVDFLKSAGFKNVLFIAEVTDK